MVSPLQCAQVPQAQPELFFPLSRSSGTAGLGLRAWTRGSPRVPLDSVAQSGGINNHRSPQSAGERDPSCFLHGVTPGTPGCCAVREQGNNYTPGMLCCWGKPWVARGTGEPQALFQPVARKHHLPEKYPLPLHTYHVRLLLLQPASLSCGAGIRLQFSSLAWSLVAGKSRQQPCLHLDCT